MATLATLRAKILEEIKVAATAGNSTLVLAATERLSTIEELARRQTEIDNQVATLMSANGREAAPVQQPSVHTEVHAPAPALGESPRARGDRLRLDFVRQLASRGYRLVQVRGALFKNRAAEQVGIAYASERKQQGWFLGLPEGAFNCAVLLLESKAGRLSAVCLPRAFFTKYGKDLSRAQGQLKFNVNLRGGHYVMTIPKVGQVAVDEFVNNYSAIAGGAT